MTLNDLLDSKDNEFLRAQILFNVSQMLHKYKIDASYMAIANNNVFKIYDAAINSKQIPEDKHEKALLLATYNYYSLLVDSFRTFNNYEKLVADPKITSKSTLEQKTTYSIMPITKEDIQLHLENMCIYNTDNVVLKEK